MNALQLGTLRQASERKRSYEGVTRSLGMMPDYPLMKGRCRAKNFFPCKGTCVKLQKSKMGPKITTTKNLLTLLQVCSLIHPHRPLNDRAIGRKAGICGDR